ncbi:MAG: hypothetical protein LUG16_00285, partial [Candidatus Gastranaerophilales bacterium]|nr:hypothetical protein [Candidatus Gastranaerophilales bacterium]
MFDIVIQPFVAKFDGTNILLACLAGHLTIFAFGYPYIYRAISNLSNISVILTERLKNNKLRKYYSKFIIVIFTSNLVSLLFPNIGMISILSCAFLFSHIWYVMTLYQIIENVAINPFEIVVNKNIHDANAVIKVPNEIEKDIELVIDLICYSEKNCFTEPDIAKYFTWLIDVTFLKLKNYNIDKFDHLFCVMPEDSEILFSTLSKIRWLNQWAVNEKKLMTLGLINNFYSWILEYGMSPTKNFNDEAYPILKNVRNTQNLYEEYENAKDNKAKYSIQKQYNFIKRIQNEILEEIKYVIFYRINNQFIASGEIYDLVQLLY